MRKTLILTAILLFWSITVVKFGPAKGLRYAEVGQISRVFQIWDTAPAHEHFYLPFYKPGNFVDKKPYVHFPPVFMFLLYGYLKAVGFILGAGLETAQNYVFLPYLAVLALVLFYSFSSFVDKIDFRRGFLFFLTTGAVMTSGSLWSGFVLRNINFHALAAILFLLLAHLDFKGELYKAKGFWVLLALAILAPLYALIGIFVFAILYDKKNPAPAVVRKAGAFLLIVTLVNAYLPTMVYYVAGIFSRAGGSSLFYRSGLDGSAKYFGSMLGSALEPFEGARLAHVLYLPVLALIALGGMYKFLSVPKTASRLARLWLIALSPYLFKVIFFPQAVSIHPYLFDSFLSLSSLFCLGYCVWQPETLPREKGGALLLLFFLFSAIIMTNLIDVSRGAWR